LSYKKIFEKKDRSLIKFFFAWMFVSIGIILVPNIEIAASVSVLNYMMSHSPRAFIFLETFMFVAAIWLFAEGLVCLSELALATIRKSLSGRRPRESREA